MTPQAKNRYRQLQTKVHGVALGMTLGLGTMYIGQVCPLVGQ
jgi:hypothetical protein